MYFCKLLAIYIARYNITLVSRKIVCIKLSNVLPVYLIELFRNKLSLILSNENYDSQCFSK